MQGGRTYVRQSVCRTWWRGAHSGFPIWHVTCFPYVKDRFSGSDLS